MGFGCSPPVVYLSWKVNEALAKMPSSRCRHKKNPIARPALPRNVRGRALASLSSGIRFGPWRESHAPASAQAEWPTVRLIIPLWKVAPDYALLDFVVNGHIYTDKEISGTTGERAGYRQLLAAAEAHQFDAIIVESQDRLWRDQAEMHAALKRLRFWGIKVFSATN